MSDGENKKNERDKLREASEWLNISRYDITRYDPVYYGTDGRSPSYGEMVHSPIGDYVKWDDVKGILAEHPADDDEPVTEGWLVSIGAEHHGPLNQFAIGVSPRVLYWPLSHDEWFIEANCEMRPIRKQETRGDVRRLCRALGVELKEPASETEATERGEGAGEAGDAKP